LKVNLNFFKFPKSLQKFKKIKWLNWFNMSLLGEIFAKKFAEKENVDWENVMQALASYKHFSPDVRLEISGLKNLGRKILDEFLKFKINFKPKFIVDTNYNDGLKIFSLVGSEEEIVNRIKYEIERKREIFPFLLKNAKEFTSRLIRNLYMFEPMILLRGSASPKSNNLFIYYEKSGKKIFVSDADLEIFFPYVPDEIKKYIKEEAYDFSLKTKIPINTHITNFSLIDKGSFKYSYPLFVPYKI
jgi:hypothetical protein